VHCVIIGFALHDAADKRIFEYETMQSDPHEIKAKNINPYLVDARIWSFTGEAPRFARFPKSVSATSP